MSKPTHIDGFGPAQIIAFIVFLPIFFMVASSFHKSSSSTPIVAAETPHVAAGVVPSRKGPSAADKSQFEALLKSNQ